MNFTQLKQWAASKERLPLIMGILNVTPDSFSDGNKYVHHDTAVKKALQMIHEGADIIDIGAESTRPGYTPVSADEQLSRLIPVLERLQSYTDIVISVDTSKAPVMQEVLKYNVSLINDVTGLASEDSLNLLKHHDVFMCLMHSDPPKTHDIVNDINDFFKKRLDKCKAYGIKLENIILDPGFGFNKKVKQNLSIVKHINAFQQHGRPILLGASRKSTIGKILDKDVRNRLYGGLAVTGFAMIKGANIIRTHDVMPTADTIKMLNAIRNASFEE